MNLAALLETVYGRLDPSSRSQESAAAAAAAGRDWAASTAPMFRVTLPAGAASTAAAHDTSHALEGIIHQILSNVASGALNPSRGAGAADLSLPLFQVLHGDPGDYVWGAGGLDSVISQLLNNLEATGPPPMSQKEINLIPTVEVTQEEVSKNLQCSVCMEDFKARESVRRLPCTHLYHADCIVPWLQMHATCPICRKTISSEAAAPAASEQPQPPPPQPPPSSSHYFDLNDYD